MELFRLFGTILIDDQSAIESLKKVDDQGKQTSTKLSNIAATGAKIGAAVVAGTGVAIGGLMAMANDTSENAAQWLELSQRTGMGIENLERWGYACSQSGADIGVLETGMKKLSKSMVDAQDGSKKSQEAYAALGISMTDLAKMSPEQAFETVMAKLADMPDSAEKNVIGNQLLGKSYTELRTLLAEGSDGMQNLKDNADKLGIVMSGDSVVAAEGFGDTMDNAKASLEGVKNKIISELLPQLTTMLNWFIDKSPVIQDVGGKALGFISDTIGFITDNSNILIPVLGGLLGAIMALQVINTINGIMTVWKASTIAQTFAQGGLNAVLMANPIGLVIAAIAAIIAIGIALYMNWDRIKEKAGALWNKIKTVFSGIKTSISEGVHGAVKVITEVFGTILFIMTHPFETAMEAIKIIIDKIKGFLNFQWEFPKLKMPHFKASGSMNPIDWIEEGVPKLSVEWYAKGAIFDKPTIFNTKYGLKGVGDASSPEVVAPLDNLKRIVEAIIYEAVTPLYAAVKDQPDVYVENTTYFGDDRIYKAVKRAMQSEKKRKGYTLTTVL